MTQKSKNEHSQPPDLIKPSPMRERLREGTDTFDFHALLDGVSNLETPRSNPAPEHAREAATRSDSGPVYNRPTDPETPRGRRARPALHWSVAGLILTGAAVWMIATHVAQAGGNRTQEPNGALASADSSSGASSSFRFTDTDQPNTDAQQAAQLPDGGRPPATMRLIGSNELLKHCEFWFVSATNQASAMQPLPEPDRAGQVVLNVPYRYNQPGAQLRILDRRSGRVARLPIVDFGPNAMVVRQDLSTNLLQNADFTHGLQSWRLERSNGKAEGSVRFLDGMESPPAVAGRVIHFDITAIDVHNWSLQCYQAGVDLQDGKPYRVSFWARANRARPLTIDMILDRPDWHRVGVESSVALTPEWHKYSFSVTPTRTQPGHTRLSFILGDALGSVELAGLALRRVTGPDQVEGASSKAALTLAPADFK